MNSEHFLLRNGGDIVGFGKRVTGPDTGKQATKIHGHELGHFAKSNEDLVGVHSIQIFTEFEHQLYPYAFKSFDDPHVLLGDLNKPEKAFKQVVSWDSSKLVANPYPSLCKLGPAPQTVSADILKAFRGSIP